LAVLRLGVQPYQDREIGAQIFTGPNAGELLDKLAEALGIIGDERSSVTVGGIE